MKAFMFLFGMAAAGLIGYLLEPNYREQLTGRPAIVTPAAAPATAVTETAHAIDFSALLPSQLPATVILNAPLKVNDPQAGTSMTLDLGSRLKPLRIEDGKLIARAGETGPIFPVAINQTDLAAQLAAKPPTAPITPDAPTPNAPTPAEPATPFGRPTITPETAPNPFPEPVKPAEKPTPAPTEHPLDITPAPVTPIPATPPPTGGEGSGAVAIMQDHIRGESIKEFRFAQVVDWRDGPEETIDGTRFQTGIATYQAETIFGTRQIEAKALIRNGKVARWVWPKSGMEIR